VVREREGRKKRKNGPTSCSFKSRKKGKKKEKTPGPGSKTTRLRHRGKSTTLSVSEEPGSSWQGLSIGPRTPRGVPASSSDERVKVLSRLLLRMKKGKRRRAIRDKVDQLQERRGEKSWPPRTYESRRPRLSRPIRSKGENEKRGRCRTEETWCQGEKDPRADSVQKGGTSFVSSTGGGKKKGRKTNTGSYGRKEGGL